MSPLNDWFIGLVKMIVVPVVFCVVTLGIASMDSLRKAGRIGVKALGYFFVAVAGLDADRAGRRQHLQTRRRHEHRRVHAGRQHDPRRRLRGEDRLRRVRHQHDPRLPVRGDHRARDPRPRCWCRCCSAAPSTSPRNHSAPITKLIEAAVARRVQDRRLGHAAGPASAPSARWRRWSPNTAPPACSNLGYLVLLFTATCVVYVVVLLGLISPRLRTQPVHPDALLQDRTAHRVEHLLQ